MTFDDFWKAYPRKVGKGAARKSFMKALSITSSEKIMRAVNEFRRNCIGRDPQFICHPATWLNQERWDDEPDQIILARPEDYDDHPRANGEAEEPVSTRRH